MLNVYDQRDTKHGQYDRMACTSNGSRHRSTAMGFEPRFGRWRFNYSLTSNVCTLKQQKRLTVIKLDLDTISILDSPADSPSRIWKAYIQPISLAVTLTEGDFNGNV